MQRHDAVTRPRLQALVTAAFPRRNRDDHRWNAVGFPNVGHIELANFAGPRTRMQANEWNPEAGVSRALRPKLVVATTAIKTSDIQW